MKKPKAPSGTSNTNESIETFHDNYETYRMFRSVYGALRIFGLHHRYTGSKRKRYHVFVQAVLFVTVLFAAVSFASILFGLVHLGISASSTSNLAMKVIRSLVSAKTLNHAKKHWKQLHLLLLQLTTMMSPLSSQQVSTVHRKLAVAVVVTLLYTIVAFTLCEYISFDRNSNPYFDNKMYSYVLSRVTMKHTSALVVDLVDAVLYLYIVTANNVLIIFYMAVCYSITSKLRQYNARIKSAFRDPDDVSSEMVRRFHDDYCELLTIVSEADDIYSALVLLWFGEIIVNACLVILILCVSVTELNFYEFLFLFLDLFYNVSLFTAASLVAAEIFRLGSIQLLVVHEAASSGNFNQWLEQCEILRLISRFTEGRMYLTGWKCFIITRGFILTVIGVVASYVVMMVQIALNTIIKPKL